MGASLTQTNIMHGYTHDTIRCSVYRLTVTICVVKITVFYAHLSTLHILIERAWKSQGVVNFISSRIIYITTTHLVLFHGEPANKMIKTAGNTLSQKHHLNTQHSEMTAVCRVGHSTLHLKQFTQLICGDIIMLIS